MEGGETTGLPAAGAAFSPQGVERVNRSMRRKHSEPPRRWRLQKGEPLFGLYKERFPRKYFASFFIVSFMRVRRAEKAARRPCQSIYYFCSDLGVENAGHAAGARDGLLVVLRPMERAIHGAQPAVQQRLLALLRHAGRKGIRRMPALRRGGKVGINAHG